MAKWQWHFRVVEKMASGRRVSLTELDGVVPPPILPVGGCLADISVEVQGNETWEPARLANLTKSQSSEGQKLYVVTSSFTVGWNRRATQTASSVYRDMCPEACDRDDESRRRGARKC